MKIMSLALCLLLGSSPFLHEFPSVSIQMNQNPVLKEDLLISAKSPPGLYRAEESDFVNGNSDGSSDQDNQSYEKKNLDSEILNVDSAEEAESVQTPPASSLDNDSSALKTDQRQEQPEGLEAAEFQPLYCYTVMPGYEGPLDFGDPDIDCYGMGVGTVEADPWDYPVGTSFSLEELNYTLPDTFPDISYTYDGRTVRLPYDSSPEPEPFTYSIEWSRIVVANGANDGKNHYNPRVSYREHVFHLNGYVHINLPEKYTIDFAVQYPRSPDFSVSAADSFEVNQGTPIEELVPAVKEQMEKDGEIYVFEGWFDSPECMNKIDPAVFKAEKNATYYGRYVPMGADVLTIEKEVRNGNVQDHEAVWEFSFILQNDQGQYDGMLEIMSGPEGTGIMKPDEDGVFHFSLRDDQSIVLGIPENMNLQIEENNVPSNFVPAVSLNDQPPVFEGSAQTGLGDQTEILFINYKNPKVPTDIFLSAGYAVPAAGLSLCLLMLIGKKNRR